MQSLLDQLSSVGEDFTVATFMLSVLATVAKQFKKQYVITVTVSELLGCNGVLVHDGERNPIPHMG